MRGGQNEHLFQGGEAFAHAVQGYHAQGPHALANGDLAHFTSVGAADDQLPDFVGDGHRFNDGEASGVTGILAAIAAAAAIERDAVERARVEAEVLVHLFRVSYRFFAVRTDAAHEA